MSAGSYNAVTWLLDRNVDEGRASKLAFTDTVSELSYGELQKQTCRAANMLRSLGVRREERVAMIMLDTIDFPIVFLGAIRAGIVPVPLNTLLTADQYAYVLADSRARVLFVSEALYPVVKDIVGRMPDLECVVVSGKNAFGHKLLTEELAKVSGISERYIAQLESGKGNVSIVLLRRVSNAMGAHLEDLIPISEPAPDWPVIRDLLRKATPNQIAQAKDVLAGQGAAAASTESPAVSTTAEARAYSGSRLIKMLRNSAIAERSSAIGRRSPWRRTRAMCSSGSAFSQMV